MPLLGPIKSRSLLASIGFFFLLSFSNHNQKTPQNGSRIPSFCAKNHLGIESCFPTNYQQDNKLVLVQFWASWCGTCKEPNQEIQKIISMYQNQQFSNTSGIELVTISLDTDTSDWKKYLNDNHIDIGTHFCDTLAWKGELIQKFGISYLPYTFLVDGNGKILSQGLFGSALEAKIKEQIKR